MRADSYSSIASIVPFTREFMDGESTFNSTTRPTLAEVESIIDEVSGALNIALRASGFSPANIRANTTSKLACDVWTRGVAVQYVEVSHAGVGFGGDEDGRVGFLENIYKTAAAFTMQAQLGFKREGVTVTNPSYEGVSFTATTKHANRSDPDNTALDQPRIRKGMFDA